MALFHEPKLIQWVHAPGLKGLARGTTSRKVIMDKGAIKMVVAVQIIKLVQNGNEVDSLNIFKEQPCIFAQNGIICSY